MARSASASRTMDGTSSARCMAVALSEAQQDACRMAIMPVELVRLRSIPEACTAMSTILPLIVAIDHGFSSIERAELEEYAEACGAEIVEIEAEPNLHALVHRMHDALTRAERRRFKIA